MSHAIGVLGGTFDPVHHAHLRLALEVREGVGLDEVRLIPAREPPHRHRPSACAEDRLAMLEAAIEGTTALLVDAREMHRPGPSYTVDTLESLRAELPDYPLCLIIGMDAFDTLDTWHRWQELFAFAHVIVARRPGSPTPTGGPMGELLAERGTRSPAALRRAPGGSVLLWDIPPLDISATRIRELFRERRDPRYLLPDPVLTLIKERGLYLD